MIVILLLELRLLDVVFTAPGRVAELQINGGVLGALVDGGQGGLLLYDISSLESPVLLGRYSGSYESLDIAGEYAYLAGGDQGFYVVDISDPTSPELAAHVPQWKGEGHPDRPGAPRDVSVQHVRVDGDLAYVAAHWDGLVVFDVSRPDSPQRLGSFPTPGLQNSLSGSTVNPPTSGDAQNLCPIADTLPTDFVFAECLPFGNNIWNPAYWDRNGWYGEMNLPKSPGKWNVFVD